MYTITALDDDAVLVGIDEIVVKEHRYLFLEKLSTTMSEVRGAWTLPSSMLVGELFKTVRQLAL